MNITLARIDDRLIHGQVTTVWSKVANAQRIIICNDEVYNDEVRRTLLRQAAPPGMKVNVVNIEKAVAVYHNPQYQDETVFYLFTRPQDALAMVRQGVKIGTLNIGGMACILWLQLNATVMTRPGKKQLTKAVSLDDDDINAFHELNNLGVILDLRVVASDPSINIIDKINEQLIAN
ncbi:PTS fructose transporter subunit IIB [Escherichia coli]|uniref:PTS fructose transporter subunit IIB n=1 Tax=Escherichia coli TaxID=562 RepID=A0A8S0FEX6_ECOLX|nr:PTS fructose transporter subunit IIB [Escherichia coli]